jgi:hypothetical protein
MRAKISCLLAIVLTLSVGLASCTSNGGGEVPICNPEEKTFTQAEKEAFWAENGTWRATTLEEASEVAGFKVVSPDFIPEDFCRSLNIVVEDRCIALSEFFEDCELPIWVTQYWSWLENEALEPSEHAILVLTQSPGNIATGDTATEVGDYPATVEREGSEIVVLYWEIDGMYFMLAGTLNGSLSEEMVYEVAASIELD